MIRTCASFAFALRLIMALGVAMAHADAHKFPDASLRFSAPCEPASPAFKAADQSKAVSRIDSTFHAENGDAPAGVMRRARFGTAQNGRLANGVYAVEKGNTTAKHLVIRQYEVKDVALDTANFAPLV